MLGLAACLVIVIALPLVAAILGGPEAAVRLPVLATTVAIPFDLRILLVNV